MYNKYKIIKTSTTGHFTSFEGPGTPGNDPDGPGDQI